MSLSVQDVLNQIAAWHAERPLYKGASVCGIA